MSLRINMMKAPGAKVRPGFMTRFKNIRGSIAFRSLITFGAIATPTMFAISCAENIKIEQRENGDHLFKPLSAPKSWAELGTAVIENYWSPALSSDFKQEFETFVTQKLETHPENINLKQGSFVVPKLEIDDKFAELSKVAGPDPETKDTLTTAQKELETSKAKVKELEGKLSQANTKLKADPQAVLTLQTQLKEEQDAVKRAKAALEKAKTALKKVKTDAEKALAAAIQAALDGKDYLPLKPGKKATLRLDLAAELAGKAVKSDFSNLDFLLEGGTVKIDKDQSDIDSFIFWLTIQANREKTDNLDRAFLSFILNAGADNELASALDTGIEFLKPPEVKVTRTRTGKGKTVELPKCNTFAVYLQKSKKAAGKCK